MKTINWSKYTAREIRAAVEAAPLVAGPWMFTESDSFQCREPSKTVDSGFAIRCRGGRWRSVLFEEDYGTAAEARAAADASLRAQGILLDDEAQEYERRK